MTPVCVFSTQKDFFGPSAHFTERLCGPSPILRFSAIINPTDLQTMETEIWKKIVEEEIVENASIHSYNSAASRLRAAAAAAQPAALAMLNSVRASGLGGAAGLAGGGLGGGGLGGGGLGGGGLGGVGASMGQSLFAQAPQAPAPSTSSIYEMAILQQRLALEEQSRRRLVSQAAASMRHQQQQMQGLANLAQQQQRFQTLKRPAPPPKVSQAMGRLLKKRKVVDLPPLSLKKETAKKKLGGFILPKVGGKDSTPTIKSLSLFQNSWKKLEAKAESKDVEGEEKHAFVRFHFEKTLLQNRALRQEVKVEDSTMESDGDAKSSDEEEGDDKDVTVKKEAAV